MSYNPGAFPQVRASDPGSWARDTAVRRIPHDIFPRMMKENAGRWPEGSAERIQIELQALVASLKSGQDGVLEDLLPDPSSPDAEYWNTYILGVIPAAQRNWMDAPWVVAEYYFYRRVAQAVRYFDTRYDPFAATKFDGLCSSLPAVERLSAVYISHLDGGDRDAGSDVARREMAFGIYAALWGNKKDLSLWPSDRATDDNETGNSADVAPTLAAACAALDEQARARVLENHIDAVIERLCQPGEGSKSVGIVVDNAGFELICDLLLGYVLLQSGHVETVHLYTKGYPTFVSDATTRDCMNTVNILRGGGDTITLNPSNTRDASSLPVGPFTRRLGQGLFDMVATGRMSFRQDVYWCLPTPYADMPPDTRRTIEGESMLFIKGDANYRRLIDDRKCPYDTPSYSVFRYWPEFIGVSVCALRSCKSEVCCGVSRETATTAQDVHGEQWVVNGEWGLIQFAG